MTASIDLFILPPPAAPDLLIGIVGSGVMGRGIAQIAALAGAQVRLVDARPGAASAAVDALGATLDMLAARNKIGAPAAAAARARLGACDELAGLARCHVVIEAIAEDVQAKRSLFAALEAIVDRQAIFATNTSSLSVTAIAAGLRHPERVAGFHFFNPVPLMKIVEVIGGLASGDATVDYLLALGRHWGHRAVRAADTPGFIVNHAGRGYGTEGLRILAEGVTDPVTLDRVLRDCAGFKLGPCELLDLTGLDVSHPVMESIYRQYYDEPRFQPQGLTRAMLSAGLLGRKSGRGFYRYDEQGRQQLAPEPASAAAPALPASVWLSDRHPELARRLHRLIDATGVTRESGAVPSAGALCLVTPLGEDASACCAREGLDPARTVGVETLFDLSRRRLAMGTPATAPSRLEQARALLGADGVPVSVVADSAGLIAQRVVAHIVNIACDIAQQGIATPDDIDGAVSLGLGYPHPPLAWGDQLGAATVLAILDNLREHSGDMRYRASPWLRRRAALGLSLRHRAGVPAA